MRLQRQQHQKSRLRRAVHPNKKVTCRQKGHNVSQQELLWGPDLNHNPRMRQARRKHAEHPSHAPELHSQGVSGLTFFAGVLYGLPVLRALPSLQAHCIIQEELTPAVSALQACHAGELLPWQSQVLLVFALLPEREWQDRSPSLLWELCLPWLGPWQATVSSSKPPCKRETELLLSLVGTPQVHAIQPLPRHQRSTGQSRNLIIQSGVPPGSQETILCSVPEHLDELG